MKLAFKTILLICLVILSLSKSHAQSNVQNENIDNQNVFTPITTDAYTDSLYFKNLEKSKAEINRLNNPPTIQVTSPLPLNERIKNYEAIRDNYPKNSTEYNDIQFKINKLKKELINTLEPNE